MVLESGAPFDSNQVLPLTNAGPHQLNRSFAANASRSIKNWRISDRKIDQGLETPSAKICERCDDPEVRQVKARALSYGQTSLGQPHGSLVSNRRYVVFCKKLLPQHRAYDKTDRG